MFGYIKKAYHAISNGFGNDLLKKIGQRTSRFDNDASFINLNVAWKKKETIKK